MAKGRKTGGRRPGSKNKVPPAIREIALAMVPDANKTLRELLKGAPDAVKVKCIEIVYERAFGKPKQAIELGNTEDGPFRTEGNFRVEFIDGDQTS